MTKIKLIASLALSALTVIGANVAQAQSFPSKTITIVVPTAPGGGNDSMARILAQKMGPLLGQTVIVENKPGASGAIAAEHVAKAPADGHVIMFGFIATHSMSPALQKLKYDPIKDFEPIGLVGYSPTLMVASATLKEKDPKAILAYLKANSGKVNYASAGNGSAPHFAGELFKMNAGIDMLHIPYKGSAPAVTDTMAGQTLIMFPSLFTGAPHVKTGKLTAVAIAGEKRSAVLPNVPTLKELGVNGVNVTQWYGLLAPANTPKAVIQQLNTAMNKVLNDKAVMAQIEGQGTDVETSTPEQFKKLIVDDLAKWKKVVQAAKLTAD
jgi:tripartite-type tricarboxylate transporter receptor subunit TctC